ncbi:hypothetical protein E1B28_008779 [Marasmius oreades]|uniref:Uncharacterized protein n=1 Tax=Marasmius oreades TaxID=181124 RepID=A0A9P7RZM3_9AGAR|nr:uncharacterized protein E1B28_008779 [Marasmius oreades]KAG7092423.1 hypothetical protein E1B28_008779 [Marasmius oreades]
MLPANPRAGGLPSNPRSNGPGGRRYGRERTSRDEDPPATSARPSRSFRPTTPSARGEASRRSNDSSGSSSSVTSSGSSFLGRIQNETSGYASSVTTAECDYEDENRKVNGRERVQEDGSAQTAGEGYGQTIWSRVATAASSLTVNVSKAWATNIATYAGEETPPGQESRLTRAMKAYHVEKARDPADLPTWLFDEHERRVRKPDAEPPSSAPRGLRDVYDAATTPGPTHPAPRKGTDRLKALREGKRAEQIERLPEARKARVGLPGGPARNRRV